MKFSLIIIAILVILIPKKIGAQIEEQDSVWQWARFTNITNSYLNEEIRTDFNDNIFQKCVYQYSINIEDTSFQHEGNYDNHQGYALVKRNPKGDFFKAADIYTTIDEYLFSAEMELDKESNVYIYGTFTDTLFINGHIVTLPNPNHVDVYLLKLDNDFNFQWAQTISYIYQDDCRGMASSNDSFIYLSVRHFGGGEVYANYFNQDSAQLLNGLNSLLKIDPQGHIIWRSEIRDASTKDTHVGNTIIGDDSNIYLTGWSSGDLCIQGDTIKHPWPEGWHDMLFISKFDPEGFHKHSIFSSYRGLYINEQWFNADSEGFYYVSGFIDDTLVFGIDTILVSDDSAYAFIAKMDSSLNPVWYQGIKASWGNRVTFQIDLINDSVAFAFTSKSAFTFMEQYYSWDAIGEIFMGMFSPGGELINLQRIDATKKVTLSNLSLDNCNNILIDGKLSGLSHIGSDSLDAGNSTRHFMAKNLRTAPDPLHMPADTISCGPMLLIAPDKYLYYQWNGVLSYQHWIIVDSTSTINLKVANEDCCWSEAEIQVTIYTSIEFSLGNDTTIFLSDTLEINTIEGYSSYLWSTGDTTSNLLIPATELQIGNNQIWLIISNDTCSASDTIIVNVVDNSLIPENDRPDILLYPNPAATNFQIISRSGEVPETISIYNCDGKRVLKLHPTSNQIEIKSLEHGVYIVQLEFQEFAIKRKLIIL